MELETLGRERLTRYTEIARLLLKYRNAGIFSASDLDEQALLELSGTGADAPGKPESLAADLEALGPTFIKIGQALSTRPDMVTPAYITALERMQDEVNPLPFETIRELVEQRLGVRLTKAFLSFEERPLASASLGQVHHAVLRDGRHVAVKVLRPGVRRQVLQDLDALRQIADQVDRHSDTGRRYGFYQWLEEGRRSLLRELDYQTEAENLETMHQHMRPYPNIHVPRPIRDYCRPGLLTMDFMPGSKITRVSDFRRLGEDWDELATQLMRSYLDQLFVHGFVHVDPPPGNVLLTDDGQLVVLDLGMVTHLTPKLRDRLLNLMLAVVDGRGEDAADRAIELGARLGDFDRTALVRAISHQVAEYAAGTQHMGEGRLLLEVTRLSAEQGLRPPPEVTLLGKTLLNLETLCNRLSPDLRLQDIVRDRMQHIVRNRTLQSLSPSGLASTLLETHTLMRDIPHQATQILDALANNRFRMKVDAVDEAELMTHLQKIANRITMGLVLAALIVGAAMLMRVETSATLFGYPAFAMVMFLGAGLLGFFLVLTIMFNDRHRR